MTERDKAQIAAFEKDLAEVYAKHLMVIDSCSCCGGCWITAAKDETEAREYAEAMLFTGEVAI